jgi:hypothetical protein
MYGVVGALESWKSCDIQLSDLRTSCLNLRFVLYDNLLL